MNSLTDIGTIKEIMSRHGFSFSKSLGQNFLINPSICPKMASLCGADENTGVIEIGPGIGVLTRELAKTAKKVVAVELDRRLIPVLDETLSGFDNIKVMNADFMKTDTNKLIDEEFADMDVVVCANLPYYITSPLIMKLLEEKSRVRSLTVMVQKEAAQRICADMGTRNSSSVTAAVHYHSEPTLLFYVKSGSFMPSPKVDSAVIRLDISAEPTVKVSNEKMFFKVVRGAFLQRRKTLSNSLSSALSLDKQIINDILKSASIPESFRAEQLSLQQFALISDILFERGV